MGFRSTFVTQDLSVTWPDWFRAKYEGVVHFPQDRGPISSIFEAKTYSLLSELPEDIRKCLSFSGRKKFVLIYLHECGGITRVEIREDDIVYTEPTGYCVTDGVEHDYCYGCSGAERYHH